MVLKDLGGNVFNAMKSFFQRHFAHATHAIRSQVTAGSVHHDGQITQDFQSPSFDD